MKLEATQIIKKLACTAVLMALSYTAAAQGDVVITSRLGDGSVNTDPPYAELTGNWSGSTLKSSAAGLPSRPGSRFATAAGTSFLVAPTLPVAGGEYHVEITHGAAGSISDDLVVQVDVVGGTGLPATTDVFQEPGANTWERIGTLKLDEGKDYVEITFTHVGGSASRFYADGIRFVNASNPCLNALPVVGSVTGPLAAGQTFVNVPGVSSNAVKVVVYADGVAIGEKTADVTEGLNVVETSALVRGQQITATQADSTGVESCRPAVGALVGGGPNPVIRVALSIRQNQELTGPIGAKGPTAGPLKMLGAFGPTSGFGTAPAGDIVIDPMTCWQTVTLLRGEDPANSFDPTYAWAGGDFGNSFLLGDYGVLDAIALSIEDTTDTGPFLIYIDNLVNGNTVIQDFEGVVAGSTNVQFMEPGFSGSTSPYLLAPGAISPNVSIVTSEEADTGSNSAQISWQFKDPSADSWVRLYAGGSGAPNPIVDLRQPISFRILLLPVGQTSGTFTISELPDISAEAGESATFEVQVTEGEGPFTYQWKFNGEAIAGATSPTLTVTGIDESKLGLYSVVVSNATCSAEARGRLSFPTVLPEINITKEGDVVTLTWQGGFTLQSTTSLDVPFQDVENAASPYQVDTSAAAATFFRLRL